MIDRNVEYPNRYELQKVSGTDNIFDMIPAPGEVFAEGDYINKSNLIPDSTVKKLWATPPENPQVKDALDVLSPAALYKTISVTLNDKNIGDIIRLNETANGKTNPAEFIVLSKNYESTGRCLVIRKNAVDVSQYYGDMPYSSSSLDTYCNTTYLSLLDSDVQSQITDVPIEVESTLGGPITTIERRGFALSGKELNLNVSGLPVEGSTLSYFASDSDRVSNLKYWTRTMNADSYVYSISLSGGFSHLTPIRDTGVYPRPAFTLPLDFLVEVIPSLVDVFDNLIMPLPAARIVTGSYVGTGTYGASNPTTLSFDAPPSAVIIRRSDGASVYGVILIRESNDVMIDECLTNPGSTYHCFISWNGNSVEFYNNSSGEGPGIQMNYSGGTYYYIAFLGGAN